MNSHFKILQQARTGNPLRAWRLFEELGLGGVTDDVKILTLKGRLLKDLAWRASGEDRSNLFQQASNAYLAAHAIKADSYPLINAAALALFASDGERSHDLARQTLQLIESGPNEGETPYWREATRAEAHLLLGEQAQAEVALFAGISKLPHAWEDHARTIEQFSAIIELQGGDAAWLDPYRPPCSLHFSGLIGLDPDAPSLREQIDRAITELAPGFAYGALAAGADIMIAEAVVQAGARLHVTLPTSIDVFRATSVEPFGSDWVTRYDDLIERADEVVQLSSVTTESGAAFALEADAAGLVSMGQAIRNADVLSSRAHALTIVAPGEMERVPLAVWANSERPLHSIETVRVAVGRGDRIDAKDVRSNFDLAGLIQLGQIDAETANKLAVKHDLEPVPAISGAAFAGAPSNCIEAIRSAVECDNESNRALIVGVFAAGQLDPLGIDRINRLCQAAEAGQVLTDYQSAMIVRVLAPALRIEELGEVASLSGPVPVWSLDPKAL